MTLLREAGQDAEQNKRTTMNRTSLSVSLLRWTLQELSLKESTQDQNSSSGSGSSNSASSSNSVKLSAGQERTLALVSSSLRARAKEASSSSSASPSSAQSTFELPIDGFADGLVFGCLLFMLDRSLLLGSRYSLFAGALDNIERFEQEDVPSERYSLLCFCCKSLASDCPEMGTLATALLSWSDAVKKHYSRFSMPRGTGQETDEARRRALAFGGLPDMRIGSRSQAISLSNLKEPSSFLMASRTDNFSLQDMLVQTLAQVSAAFAALRSMTLSDASSTGTKPLPETNDAAVVNSLTASIQKLHVSAPDKMIKLRDLLIRALENFQLYICDMQAIIDEVQDVSQLSDAKDIVKEVVEVARHLRSYASDRDIPRSAWVSREPPLPQAVSTGDPEADKLVRFHHQCSRLFKEVLSCIGHLKRITRHNESLDELSSLATLIKDLRSTVDQNDDILSLPSPDPALDRFLPYGAVPVEPQPVTVREGTQEKASKSDTLQRKKRRTVRLIDSHLSAIVDLGLPCILDDIAAGRLFDVKAGVMSDPDDDQDLDSAVVFAPGHNKPKFLAKLLKQKRLSEQEELARQAQDADESESRTSIDTPTRDRNMLLAVLQGDSFLSEPSSMIVYSDPSDSDDFDSEEDEAAQPPASSEKATTPSSDHKFSAEKPSSDETRTNANRTMTKFALVIQKRGNFGKVRHRRVQKRYFELDARLLSYYNNDSKGRLCGSISLENVETVALDEPNRILLIQVSGGRIYKLVPVGSQPHDRWLVEAKDWAQLIRSLSSHAKERALLQSSDREADGSLVLTVVVRGFKETKRIRFPAGMTAQGALMVVKDKFRHVFSGTQLGSAIDGDVNDTFAVWSDPLGIFLDADDELGLYFKTRGIMEIRGRDPIALGTVEEAAGWLSRREGSGMALKPWKRRYYQLKGRRLLYGVSDSALPSGYIDLRGSMSVEGNERSLCFTLSTMETTHLFRADTVEELRRWMAFLLHLSGESHSWLQTAQRNEKEGFMFKLSGSRSNVWQKRWFVVADGFLSYYKTTTGSDEREAKGYVPLFGDSVSISTRSQVRPHTLGLVVSTAERDFVMHGETDLVTTEWCEALREHKAATENRVRETLLLHTHLKVAAAAAKERVSTES